MQKRNLLASAMKPDKFCWDPRQLGFPLGLPKLYCLGFSMRTSCRSLLATQELEVGIRGGNCPVQSTFSHHVVVEFSLV